PSSIASTLDTSPSKIHSTRSPRTFVASTTTRSPRESPHAGRHRSGLATAESQLVSFETALLGGSRSREETAMHVTELWRYPVKSMAGERLTEVNLTPLGLDGDRIVHVENARGRVVTARTHPKLLGHRAVLDAQGEPLVDSRAWTDPSVTADIECIVGGGHGWALTIARGRLPFSLFSSRP